MRTMMRSRVAGVLLVALMALCGCGGGSPAGGRDGGGGGGGGNGGGQGAPINIPSIVQDQGRPLETVHAEIEASVREQCGGELCIDLQVVEQDPGFEVCQFVRTDPAQGSSVERGATVLIVAGTEACEDPAPTDEATETSGPDGTGEDDDFSDVDPAS